MENITNHISTEVKNGNSTNTPHVYLTTTHNPILTTQTTSNDVIPPVPNMPTPYHITIYSTQKPKLIINTNTHTIHNNRIQTNIQLTSISPTIILQNSTQPLQTFQGYCIDSSASRTLVVENQLKVYRKLLKTNIKIQKKSTFIPIYYRHTPKQRLIFWTHPHSR